MKSKPAAVFDQKKIRELFIVRQGPSASAWMVFKHRKAFHNAGAFDFVLPGGEEVPRWFEYGIALLRKRKCWAVLEFQLGDKRIFRVTWKRWRKYASVLS